MFRFDDESKYGWICLGHNTEVTLQRVAYPSGEPALSNHLFYPSKMYCTHPGNQTVYNCNWTAKYGRKQGGVRESYLLYDHEKDSGMPFPRSAVSRAFTSEYTPSSIFNCNLL